jgi:hypothetical protein
MQTVIFNTSGTGYWSGDIKAVVATNMTLPSVNDDNDFGELRVYFDTETWNTEDSGLIYTDKQWLKELQAFLIKHGLAGMDVHYSEQGMQGNDYVSLDVGKDFIASWHAKFGMAIAIEAALA